MNEAEIQRILDRAKAIEVRGYIERRNRLHPHSKATLRLVCDRFKLRQGEIKRVIDSVDYLVLSSFAYVDPTNESWGEQMIAAWWPQVIEPGQVPDGKRLVMILEDSAPCGIVS